MSVYFDLGTEEIYFGGEQTQTHQQNNQQQIEEKSVTFSQKQTLLIQNENRIYRESLAQKRQQIAMLSHKSFTIGKQCMKMLKQKSELQTKYNKLKTKQKSIKQQLQVCEMEKKSIESQANFEKEEAQRKYKQVDERLQKILSMGEVDASKLKVAVEEIRSILNS